jgi:hypothetical protein
MEPSTSRVESFIGLVLRRKLEIGLSLIPISLGAFVFTGLRVGPGRAAVLALRSLCRPAPRPLSIRSKEVAILSGFLRSSHWEDEYIAVTGPKGVGKSCLINTATAHTAGVVHVTVAPGASDETVKGMVMRAVTHQPWTVQDPERTFRRVIFWHRVLTLGKSPVVVMSLGERLAGEEYAKITTAIRSFATNYKLRVIVDASPNSVDSRTLETGRCVHMEVDLMTTEAIESIEEFSQLRNLLQEANLYAVALEMLSGSPLAWKTFRKSYETRLDLANSASARKALLESALMKVYSDTRRNIKLLIRSDPHLYDVADLYFARDEVLAVDFLEVQGFKRPSPDKAFRIKAGDEGLLQPITRAVHYVLKYGRTKTLNIDDLKALVAVELANRHR